jgi:ferredoxin-NADP reductase
MGGGNIGQKRVELKKTCTDRLKAHSQTIWWTRPFYRLNTMGGSMNSYKSRLIRCEEVAENTMSFHFEKPEGFRFKAGQYVELALIDPRENDLEGSSRAFSIASAPSEPDLMFATRMQDTAFKRVLKNAPSGTEVILDGPMGSFTLHKNTDKPAVFLAGGIGITPFLSIVLEAAGELSPHRLYLFYSNRRPEDASFLDRLYAAEQANPNFRFVPTMTAMAKSMREWKGETGYIGQAMLSKHLPSLQGPIYYTAGPPSMVEAMLKMLEAAKVDADDIRSEEFGGY